VLHAVRPLPVTLPSLLPPGAREGWESSIRHCNNRGYVPYLLLVAQSRCVSEKELQKCTSTSMTPRCPARRERVWCVEAHYATVGAHFREVAHSGPAHRGRAPRSVPPSQGYDSFESHALVVNRNDFSHMMLFGVFIRSTTDKRGEHTFTHTLVHSRARHFPSLPCIPPLSPLYILTEALRPRAQKEENP